MKSKFSLSLFFSALLLLYAPFVFTQNAPFSAGGGSGSAGSSTLGQQGNIPVNYFNGEAQISVPLLGLKANHLSMPISLGYNTRGIKVDQAASNVGLGWGLNAGGVITRTVNGLPDDCFSVSFEDGVVTNNASRQ